MKRRPLQSQWKGSARSPYWPILCITVRCVSSCLPLFEELAYLLLHSPGNGNTPGARILQHASISIQRMEQFDDFFRHTMFHHNGIGGVHLDDTGVKLTHCARNLSILQHLLRSKFKQSRLTDEQLVVRKEISLHHVYFLFNLARNLHHLRSEEHTSEL